MSAHLERARLLLAQARPADAENEAMQALAAQPQDAGALAVLALSRAAQDKRAPALEAAREAVGLAPDVAYLHYVHAHVQHRLDREDDAFRAIQEALRLDPHDADYHAELAAIELSRGNWPASLEAAERALAIDAEHVGAANLRAMALVRLGRKAEAVETVDYALHRAPENALSHANQGWNLLHQNDPKRAQEHFREALRLDPELDYARDGMLEALKARNPIYRGMLAYFLWMSRQSSRLQWLLVLGILFGTGLIGGMAAANPQLGWLLWPVLGLFYVFVYLSWTAQPMFDLFLRFDRFGRHVLSDAQRRATYWFGATFILAIAAGLWWASGAGDAGKFATLVLAALSICIAASFRATGRNFMILFSATAGLAVVAVAAAVLHLRGDVAQARGLIGIFRLGFLGFQFLSNSLAR